MRARLLAAFLAVSVGAFGADREFDQLVNAVQSRFGVQQTHIPLLGVANLFLQVAHPKGAAGFRLAVFENLKFYAEDDGEALDGIMADASEGLHPLVRVRSRPDGEWTYIYTAEAGKTTKMLVATFGRNEATVVEVRLTMDELMRALGNPAQTGQLFAP